MTRDPDEIMSASGDHYDSVQFAFVSFNFLIKLYIVSRVLGDSGRDHGPCTRVLGVVHEGGNRRRECERVWGVVVPFRTCHEIDRLWRRPLKVRAHPIRYAEKVMPGKEFGVLSGSAM